MLKQQMLYTSLCWEGIWRIFTSSSNDQMRYPEIFGSSQHAGKRIVLGTNTTLYVVK